MRQRADWKIEDDYGDEHRYQSTQHGGSDAWIMQAKLIRVLTPALKEAKAALDSDEGMSNADVLSVMAPVLSQAIDNLLATMDLPFILELLKNTRRDGKSLGKKSAIDLAFQGNLGELWLALYKVVDHNFGASIRTRSKKLLGHHGLASLLSKLESVAQLNQAASSAGPSGSSSTPASPAV